MPVKRKRTAEPQPEPQGSSSSSSESGSDSGSASDSDNENAKKEVTAVEEPQAKKPKPNEGDVAASTEGSAADGEQKKTQKKKKKGPSKYDFNEYKTSVNIWWGRAVHAFTGKRKVRMQEYFQHFRRQYGIQLAILKDKDKTGYQWFSQIMHRKKQQSDSGNLDPTNKARKV
jgi:hypothetical protein